MKQNLSHVYAIAVVFPGSVKLVIMAAMKKTMKTAVALAPVIKKAMTNAVKAKAMSAMKT